MGKKVFVLLIVCCFLLSGCRAPLASRVVTVVAKHNQKAYVTRDDELGYYIHHPEIWALGVHWKSGNAEEGNDVSTWVYVSKSDYEKIKINDTIAIRLGVSGYEIDPTGK